MQMSIPPIFWLWEGLLGLQTLWPQILDSMSITLYFHLMLEYRQCRKFLLKREISCPVCSDFNTALWLLITNKQQSHVFSNILYETRTWITSLSHAHEGQPIYNPHLNSSLCPAKASPASDCLWPPSRIHSFTSQNMISTTALQEGQPEKQKLLGQDSLT